MFKTGFLNKWQALAKGAGKEVVGVELGSNSLKIVSLGLSMNKIDLLRVLVRNTSGSSDDEISQMIRTALSGVSLKEVKVISIIPSPLVITKNIEIPSNNPQEIKDIISLQAGRHTPFSREEIIVDYVEIGLYKNNYTKILLIIVARSIIKRQMEILEKAGLRFEDSFLAAEGIAVSSSKMLKLETQGAPAAIAHIDEISTDFIIVFKNKPLFVRNLPIGAAHLLDDRETYEMKFIEELKRSLEAYQNEDIEKVPTALVLCGATEQIKDLENVLNNTLHLPVSSLSYLAAVSVSQDCLKEMSSNRRVSLFDLIAPLASPDKPRASLLPQEIKLRKAFEERGREFVKTGILALAIAVLVFSIFLTQIYVKSVYLKKLDKKYQVFNSDVRELEMSSEKVSLVKNHLLARGYSLEVLTALYGLVSDDLLLSDIRFDDQGKFSVKGASEAMSSVFAFVEKIEKSPYFKDVKNRYTSKRKEGGKDVTDFEIVATLEKAP